MADNRDFDLTSIDGRTQYLMQQYGLTEDQAKHFATQFVMPEAQGGTPEANQDVIASDLDSFVQVQVKGLSPAEGSGTTAQANQSKTAISQTLSTAQTALDQGANPSDVSSQVQKAMAQYTGQTGQVPADVLSLLGKPLTPDQMERAIAAYNQLNPLDPIAKGDADSFYERLSNNYPGAALAASQVMNVDSKTVYKVFNPASLGFQEVPLDSNQILAVAGKNGENRQALQIVPEAVASTVRTGSAVPWQIVTAAAAATGAKEVEGVHGEGLPNVWAGLEKALAPGRFLDGLTQKLTNYNTVYGDPVLALIAVKDPDLAHAIFEQGGANSDQAQKVSQILLDAHLGSSWQEVASTLAQQGYAVNLDKVQALLGGGQAGGSGNNGVKVNLPDPAQLRSAARSMYEAWFSREPTDDELNTFIGTVNGAITSQAKAAGGGAGPSNPFKPQPPPPPSGGVTTTTQVDAQSQLEDQLRQSPEYQQLFGNKPIGVSEGDYANQFRQAGSNFLGGQPPSADAVRLGMNTGNVQDTQRSIEFSGNAYNNSSFLQRVYRAADVIQRMT